MAEKATHVERLKEAGLLHKKTKLSKEWQEKINLLSKSDVDALMRVGEKLGMKQKGMLEPGVAECGF
jgi:hypothetical protein